METLEFPSILTGKGAAALPGPAGGGILTLGVPGLAGLTSLIGCLGVDSLTPGELPLAAGGGVPLGAGDLMGAGDLIAPGDLMTLPAILTAGLGEALGEKFLLGADLTGCLCLSCSPSSQRGLRMLVRGSALQTKQLQLPVVASFM